MKKVLVLGSTGSIGLNTLEIIRKFPMDFEITGLSVNQNTGILNKQIEEFHPETVVVCDKLKAAEFKKIFTSNWASVADYRVKKIIYKSWKL